MPNIAKGKRNCQSRQSRQSRQRGSRGFQDLDDARATSLSARSYYHVPIALGVLLTLRITEKKCITCICQRRNIIMSSKQSLDLGSKARPH